MPSTRSPPSAKRAAAGRRRSIIRTSRSGSRRAPGHVSSWVCSVMPTNRHSAFLDVVMNAGIIDTHVHVWCRGGRPECRPSPTSRIPIPSESVPVEWLIDDMERAGITYAVLVQSSAFGANNRYIVECVRSLSRNVPRRRTGPPPRRSGSTPAEAVGITRSVRVPVPSALLRRRILARCSVQRQDLGGCRRHELDTPVSPAAMAR